MPSTPASKAISSASESTLLGAAGEHHVMCELLRRGYIAAKAPEGVPGVDIVATNRSGTRLCSIQVKARRDIGSDGGWHMSAKHEQKVPGSRLFYCFVDFGKASESTATVYVLPNDEVAEVLSNSHRQWLSNPSKKGEAHRDGKMRRFLPDYSRIFKTDNPYPKGWLDRYKSAWSLLGLDL